MPPKSTASLRLTKTQTSSSPVKSSVYCVLARRIGGNRRDHARHVVEREEEWISVDLLGGNRAGIGAGGAPRRARGKACHGRARDVTRRVAGSAGRIGTPKRVGVLHPLLGVLPPVNKSASAIVVQEDGRNVGRVSPGHIPVPLLEGVRTRDMRVDVRGRHKHGFAVAVERGLNEASDTPVTSRDVGLVEIAAKEEVAVGNRHGHGISIGIGLTALEASFHRARRRAPIAVLGVAVIAPLVDNQAVPAFRGTLARGCAAIGFEVAAWRAAAAGYVLARAKVASLGALDLAVAANGCLAHAWATVTRKPNLDFAGR